MIYQKKKLLFLVHKQDFHKFTFKAMTVVYYYTEHHWYGDDIQTTTHIVDLCLSVYWESLKNRHYIESPCIISFENVKSQYEYKLFSV